MEQLTTTSILSLFETTKDQRASFVNDVIIKVENGEVNPLLIQLQLKCMEDIIKQITSNPYYKTALVDEAEKMDGKSFQFHNSKMEIKEAGVKYHFDKTNDFFLNDAEEQLKPLTESIKARQDFLKTIPKEGMEILNEQTGEMVRVYPPYKTSTTTIQVSLK